jgi:Holliday junction resolvase RusA-like endonuclease
VIDPWALPLIVRVPGSAVPQARAGRRIVTPAGGGRPFVQSFDRPEVRDWKRTCMAMFVQAKGDRPLLADGPIKVLLRFQLLRPKSLPRRVTRPDRKPDLDNLAKAVMDAARGILYRDDGQVVDLVLGKHYAEEPGVEVWIARAAEPFDTRSLELPLEARQ